MRIFDSRATPSAALPRAASTAAPAAAELAHDVPHSAPRALDGATRDFMEPRFERDFSRVRVHTDDAADASARAVGAHAYATGEHIVFAADRYEPSTDGGRELLAHELAHVVQQADAPGTEPAVSAAGDAWESAARTTARAVAAGGVAPPAPEVAARPPAVQRDPDPSPDLTLRPSPFFLASMGLLTVDGFALDVAELTSQQETRLSLHAKMIHTLLVSDPDATIVVTGHTDATGTEQHNMDLSLARAQSARAALAAAGVPAAKLAAKGAGESRLLVTSQLPDPANRRIEVQFEPTLVHAAGGPRPVTSSGTAPPQWPAPVPPGDRWTPPPDVPWKPPVTGSGSVAPPGVPDLKLKPHNWIKDALDRDPIIRGLPGPLQPKIRDALKDLDETAAEKAIDQLPLGDKKAAVQAVVKAILKALKGERWEPPTPPLHEMPPSTAPKMDGPPTTFGPTFKFP